MKKLLWFLPLVLLFLVLSREKPYDGPKYTVDLTGESFAAEVEGGEGVYVVDFWASWCGPCRRIEPVIEELAGEFQDRMPIGKLNVDEHPDLAEKYRVSSLPTLIVFRDGKVLDRRAGTASRKRYRAWFEELLGE